VSRVLEGSTPAVDLDFATIFGTPCTHRGDAPGRVNLIGEHTDYSGGYVLPAVIGRRVRVEMRLRSDARVRVWSTEKSIVSPMVEYHIGHERPRGDWSDYIQGVTDAASRQGLRASGFDLRIESDVPIGSGLSSSAALEVAVLRALRAALDWRLDDTAVALLAHRGETEFVGAPVGIMDPMASSLGKPGSALFLNAGSGLWERVTLPAALGIAVVHSGISHSNRHGGYAKRREEIEAAAQALGVKQMRDLQMDAVASRLDRLLPPLDRRVRHVIEENRRVLAAVAALRALDLWGLGSLIRESHASLRDLFEVSTAEIDRLVELAEDEESVFGARLTGAGFGGAVVLLAEASMASECARRVAARYARESGHLPTVICADSACVPSASRG
jgi:galactokinase